GAHLGRARGLAHVLDELDHTPRHQEVAFAFSIDPQRVETISVGGHREISAELEEDRAQAHAGLIRTRSDENGFEGAEARPSNRLLVRKKAVNVREVPRVVAREERAVDRHLEERIVEERIVSRSRKALDAHVGRRSTSWSSWVEIASGPP